MKPAIWTGLYAELPLRESLETLHDHGWSAFEISTEHLVRIDSEHGRGLDSVLAYVADTGIEISQAHAFLQADVASPDAKKREEDMSTLERHLSWCAKLGVEVAVMHPGGRIDNPTKADRAKTEALNVESFRRLGDLAGSLNLRIGLENLTCMGASRPADLLD